MSAIVLAAVGLGCLLLGYLLYSRFIAAKIYCLDPAFKTPAHALEDGVDYVPTSKYVLWGHHFTSVAGAAPIIGPAIAAIWGWLPGFLWVILGTIFFAGVHDMGAVWASVRNRGQSVGAFTGDLVGKRARNFRGPGDRPTDLPAGGETAMALSGRSSGTLRFSLSGTVYSRYFTGGSLWTRSECPMDSHYVYLRCNCFDAAGVGSATTSGLY